MSLNTILKELGLNEKEFALYDLLLKRGPSSVRDLSSKAKINRGTTYDVLKVLMKRGLVSYFHKATKQKFLAEDPKKLQDFIENEQTRLTNVHAEFSNLLPELRSLYSGKVQKPVVKFYEGDPGIRTILQDVLDTMHAAKEKEYYVYSSLDVRRHLYRSFRNFTEQRIHLKISVKVISIGVGWEDEPLATMLAQRKWLSKTEGSPTFSIIYAGKSAFISLGKEKNLLGFIVEDDPLYHTQKLIFHHIWKTL